MVRTVCKYFFLGLLVLAISQLVGVAILRYNVSSFAEYWRGRANQPGDFIYVAMGDSAAQAIGASQPENGYVGLLAKRIEAETGRQVRVINISVTGARLSDALRDQVPQLAKYDADLVTAEIGANDMLDYDPLRFRQEYDAFLGALPPGRSVVSNMPFFGGRDSVNRSARQASWIISGLAAQYNLPVANLYGALRDRQSPLIYASDLFHPNNRGYRIWDEAFWPAVQPVVNARQFTVTATGTDYEQTLRPASLRQPAQ